MLLRLALRMRKKELPKIMTFMEVGLKIKSHVMNMVLTNHDDDFNLAMFRILIMFIGSYEDRRKAYAVLAQALRKAHMNTLLNEMVELEEETEIVQGNKRLTRETTIFTSI